ncbi:hypothetical protein ACV33W_08550 [Pseudomonas aeruginosa]
MSLPLPSASRRAPWFRIAAVAWLLTLSVGLVIVVLDVVRLDAPPPPSPLAGQMDLLASRLDQAELRLAALKNQAPALTPEALAMVRAQLEERVAQVESSIASQGTDQALLALQQRMEKLEAGAAPAKVPVAGRPKPTPAAPVKSAAPPFRLVGVERRGDERFLSVMPRGTETLAHIRLLRVGESVEGWTLEGIQKDTATFRVEGKLRQLVLP